MKAIDVVGGTLAYMRDDNNTNRERKSNAGKIITGLAVLAILVGVGKYIVDRNNESAEGTGNVLGLQTISTPTPTISQSFQTVTVALTGQQLTRWITQMMNPSWPISDLQATIQGNQIQVNGQSTSSMVPGAFIATMQKSNNSNDVVAVTKVTRGGNAVSATTLALINTAVNNAVKRYLSDNNLTATNMNISDGQMMLDLTGPSDKLNQIMSSLQGTPSVTP